MTEHRIHSSARIAARAAAFIAAMYLAFAVGAPWMLSGAPPSPQDVVVTKACCAKSAPAK